MKPRIKQPESNVEIIIKFTRDKHEKEINKLMKQLMTQKIKCDSFEMDISADGVYPLIDFEMEK